MMRRAFAAVMAPMIVSACTDLPAGPGVPDLVASLRFVETCPVVPVGGSCPVQVEGRDQAGNPALATNLTWSSSRPDVFTVSGAGTSATLTGRIFGRGILRVSTSRGIKAQTAVNVVPPH